VVERCLESPFYALLELDASGGVKLYYSNPVSLGAALTIGFCALIASFVPAFRASRISLLDALQVE
jgi:ABC-type antimicrobial peptide transport system permease subunit